MDNFTPYPDCTNGEVSLVGGGSPREGRVEICVNGTWVTSCVNSFDANDAVVICNQLGYPKVGLKVSSISTKLMCCLYSYRIYCH